MDEAETAPERVEHPAADVKPSVPRAEAVVAPQLDRAAVAAAEDALDATSRDRARADERALMSARRLTLATAEAALQAARARKLSSLVRDPSTRIAQSASRGGYLRGEREKLEKEVSTLRQLPVPKSKSILSKSPVARPAASLEAHFELRHGRRQLH